MNTLLRRALPELPSVLIALWLPSASRADEVVVFAAASLKTALDEIADAWEQDHNDRIVVSYAGSGQLAKQIIAGAPADIYLSAAPEWMDAVGGAGLVAEGARKDLLGNRLVLIAHGATGPAVTLAPGLDLAGMLGDGRLAMAMVEAVPAGQYGKAALASLGLWGTVAPKVAQTDNVRAALALVAAGEAPLGIVYATDAAAEPRVHVAAMFPEDSHPPIVYPAALLSGAEDASDAAFFDYLSGAVAADVFRTHGFTMLAGGE